MIYQRLCVHDIFGKRICLSYDTLQNGRWHHVFSLSIFWLMAVSSSLPDILFPQKSWLKFLIYRSFCYRLTNFYNQIIWHFHIEVLLSACYMHVQGIHVRTWQASRRWWIIQCYVLSCNNISQLMRAYIMCHSVHLPEVTATSFVRLYL